MRVEDGVNLREDQSERLLIQIIDGHLGRVSAVDPRYCISSPNEVDFQKFATVQRLI